MQVRMIEHNDQNEKILNIFEHFDCKIMVNLHSILVKWPTNIFFNV